jgi:hypothetical protein
MASFDGIVEVQGGSVRDSNFINETWGICLIMGRLSEWASTGDYGGS